MAIIEIGQQFSLGAEDRPSLDELEAIARMRADETGATSDLIDPTVALYKGYHDFHAPSAIGCITTAELALGFAHVVQRELPEAPVNQPHIWAGSLTHDLGKISLGIRLIEDSQRGYWPQSHDLTMRTHPEESRRMALEAGLPLDVAVADAAHHSVQIFRTYGYLGPLTPSQTVTTRGVGFGDFTDAMITRNNKVNGAMTLGERKDTIGDDLALKLGDSIFDGAREAIHEATMDEVVEPFILHWLPGVAMDSLASR